MASAKKIMLHQAELFGIAAAGTGICLAPGLTLFRRHLDDAAQQELANEIAEAVLQAPWFVPRMQRSGLAFSVKMTIAAARLGVPTAATGTWRRIRSLGWLGLQFLF